MANELFNASGAPATNSQGLSALVRGEFSNIGLAFDKFPALSTNTLKLLRINAAGTAFEAVAASTVTGAFLPLAGGAMSGAITGLTGLTSSGELVVNVAGEAIKSEAAAAGVPIYNYIHNTSAAAGSGAALILGVSSAANDPYIRFDGGSGAFWAIGNDGSDADSFVLSRSATLGTNNVLRVAPAGNWLIPAPSSGVALFVSGVPSAGAVSINAATNTGYGMQAGAGSIFWMSTTGAKAILGSNGGTPPTSGPLEVTNNGNVAVNAPVSGNALTVSNVTGGAAVKITGTGGTNNAAGAYIFVGDVGTSTNRLMFTVNSSAAYIYAGGSIANPDIVIANNDGSLEIARFISSGGFQIGQGGGAAAKTRTLQWSNFYYEDGIDNVGVSYVNAVNNGLAGQFEIRRNGTVTATFATTGAVTINAPTSGTALTAVAIAATPAITAVSNNAARSFSTKVTDFATIRMDGNLGNTTSAGIGFSSAGGGGAGISFSRGAGYDTSLGFYTNASGNALADGATLRLGINDQGTVTIAAPTSGGTLILAAPAIAQLAIQVTGSAVNGTRGLAVCGFEFAYGNYIATGTSELISTVPINLGTYAAAYMALYTNSLSRIVIASGGAVTINTPTSGTALTLNGIDLSNGVSASQINNLGSGAMELVTRNAASALNMYSGNGVAALSLTTTQQVDVKAGSGKLLMAGGITRFESAEQTCPAGTGTTTVAHGGPRKPDMVRVVLRCKTAEIGYSIGDEVDMTSGDGGSFDLKYTAGSASNVDWVFVRAGSPPVVANKSTGAATTVTAANWKVVIYCLWL